MRKRNGMSRKHLVQYKRGQRCNALYRILIGLACIFFCVFTGCDEQAAINETSEAHDHDAGSGTIVGQTGGGITVMDPQSPIWRAGVSIPENSLDTDISISIQHGIDAAPLPEEIERAGETVRYSPDGLAFATPVELQLPYADADNDGLLDGTRVHETDITAAYYNEASGLWQQLEGAIVDPENNVVRVKTTHFSDYAAISYLQEICKDAQSRTLGPFYFSLYYNFRHSDEGYRASVSDVGIDLNVGNAVITDSESAALRYDSFKDLFDAVLDARQWEWSWEVVDAYTYFANSAMDMTESDLVFDIAASGYHEILFNWHFDYTLMSPSDMLVVKFYAASDTVCDLLDRTPATPGNLQVIETEDTRIALQWDAVYYLYGDVFYNVYMSSDGGETFDLYATASTHAITANNLTPETLYVFKVTTVFNQTLESADSNAAQATTVSPNQPPEAPTQLAATKVERDTVELTWTAAVDADGQVDAYIVYMSDNAGASFTIVDTIRDGATAATISGLSPETAYVFQITAVDDRDDESLPSEAVRITTSN